MTFRKILFWMHLPAGLLAGAIIMIMCCTGVLLTYERQVVAWADRGYRVDPPTSGAVRLPLENLEIHLRYSGQRLPTTLTIRSDRTAPMEASFGREKTAYLNPYTGDVLGEGSKGTKAFFRWVTDWHRWLAANGPGRSTGRAITGASNLLFLFLVMSGLYLWLPRRWSVQHLKPILFFRRGLSGRPLNFNWHNVFGVWACVPLFFIVITGVIMSYPWANNLLYRVTGNQPPQQVGRGPGEGDGRRERGESSEAQTFAGLDNLLRVAEQRMPGWQSIILRIPDSDQAPVVFSIDAGSGGQPHKRGELTLNRRTAQVVRWETFASFNLGRRLRTLGRFVHTGKRSVSSARRWQDWRLPQGPCLFGLALPSR
ncbi:MAG: PepSY-associated TM helix domain-containing protein [Bryobacteraceae bacterium]